MPHWFTADPHFGHENIVASCARPFRDAEHMTAVQLERLWERVGEERVLLFDLEADPWETTDVSEFHPEILERHRQRIDEAAARLATGGRRDSAMTEEDLQRLRVLGYVDD